MSTHGSVAWNLLVSKELGARCTQPQPSEVLDNDDANVVSLNRFYNWQRHQGLGNSTAVNVKNLDLFADSAAILISIVSKDIMGYSGVNLICICPLGIP